MFTTNGGTAPEDILNPCGPRLTQKRAEELIEDICRNHKGHFYHKRMLDWDSPETLDLRTGDIVLTTVEGSPRTIKQVVGEVRGEYFNYQSVEFGMQRQ